jgi:phosphopantothenoylcysteine decarboxylase/phosphopantothenate--cysteine ligase
MGHAIAADAARRGARVVLISGPTRLDAPAGVEVVRVRRAVEMRDAVLAAGADADAIVMAAAVADYTPAATANPGKLEKRDQPLDLRLVPTPDILAELGRKRGGGARPVLVGFAAESGDPVVRGREKLRRKSVDMIVANDISRADAGFDVETNAATIITPDGEESFAVGPKTELASRILDRVEQLLQATVKNPS